jgi:uncharacterized protein (DUF433 family)
MSLELKYEHIVVGEDNVARISGTTLQVTQLIEEQHAFGWSAEELRFQHPSLTMGEIHSALAYYWDNKDEIDQAIKQRLARFDQMKEQNQPKDLIERLRQRKQA